MTPAPTRMAAWLESAWLARYLDRQLEGEELAWFEAYLLDKPELLEAVEVDNALRDAVVTDGRADPKLRAKPPVRLIGIAAALVACTGLGWFSGSRMAEAPAAIASPARILIDTYRGVEGNRSHVENAGSSSDYVLIEVAIPDGAQSPRLEAGGRSLALWRSADGFVSFLLRKPLPSEVRLQYGVDGEVIDRRIPLSNVVLE